MKTIGYNQPLYVLPFDHRGSFQTKMFGWHGELTAAQTAEIAAAKRVIYDGFKAAVAAGVPQAKAGILVDEQFGAAILAMPRRMVLPSPVPPRKAGKTSSIFNTTPALPSTSRPFAPRFARCWCVTTRRAIRR